MIQGAMRLRIVSVNDVYELTNLPRLRSLVRRAAEVDPADALLVVVAGDFLSPSILSSLDAGRGMIDCLNAVGVTHVTFGNHEDDLATEDLLARVRELRATWLATNVRALDPELPTSDVLEVAGVRVGLVGVVMNNPAVYRRAPFGGAPVQDANEAALDEAERLVRDAGCSFVVPVTHQFVDDDRALARAQRGRWFPVICGGHEHTVILEDLGGTWLVKAGADARRAAVIDVSVGASGVSASARFEEVASYPEDPELRARVDGHMRRVRALEEATLLDLPAGEVLSSIGTRVRQTSMGTMLASRIRDALGAEGCLLNGGGIRGSREHRGALTYGALKAEVPFDNEIVVARLPGRVVAEAIVASRRHAPRESGGFLQVDDRMRVEQPGDALLAVAGEPFDPAREYRIALVRNLLMGLDRIEPLVRFAEEHPERVPEVGSGRDVRMVLVDAFSVALWKQLGGFDAVDANADGRVTPSEVAAALVRVRGQKQPEVVAGLVVHALDKDLDHLISRDEADAVE